MSRIQQILDKAEREGTMRRTIQPTPAIAVRTEVVDEQDESRFDTPRRFADGDPFVAEGRQVTASVLDRLLVAGLDPHSDAAEHYRTIRARLAQHENGTALRTLMVTSPGTGEGKSVTAVNLALTMAQEIQRRVIIVDACLRRGRVHRLLGLPDGPGLAEVLAGRIDLEEAIVALTDHNLSVLPAGVPSDRPTELLGSAAMRRVIDTLRTQFDRVVLDVPAVMPLADVGTTAPLADGVLLVVRAGATTRPAIESALGAFDAGKVVGVVLNGAQ